VDLDVDLEGSAIRKTTRVSVDEYGRWDVERDEDGESSSTKSESSKTYITMRPQPAAVSVGPEQKVCPWDEHGQQQVGPGSGWNRPEHVAQMRSNWK
jgi:hypothetical protein